MLLAVYTTTHSTYGSSYSASDRSREYDDDPSLDSTYSSAKDLNSRGKVNRNANAQGYGVSAASSPWARLELGITVTSFLLPYVIDAWL